MKSQGRETDMQRIITLRYGAKCSVCGNHVAAGERAYWTKTPRSTTTHVGCMKTDNSSNVPTPVATDANASDFTADYIDVRDAFQQISKGGFAPFSAKQKTVCEFIRGLWKSDPTWVGASVSEMETWIKDGYRVDGLSEISGTLIAAKPRRKLRFADEGDELHLDLAWSGVDNHFSEWEKRVTKPGLVVEMEMAYHAGNVAQRIRPYLVWLARMLQTLDENGIDVEASMVNTVVHLTNEAGYDKPYKTRVRVKRPGEAADFSAWSALFSPGGFRQLMFTAKIMHGDSRSEITLNGLGAPRTSDKWDIEYDPDENRMIVRQTQNADFPEFDMTQKLGAIIRQIAGT